VHVPVPHPISERDYSWQPLSLHSGANRYFFLFLSTVQYKRIFLVHPGIPRCRLRGLILSVFTIRSSTRVQVTIYALTFVPCTRLIILGNELPIGSNTSFTDPLFRHLSSAIAFSICAQLTNVRITRSLLAISTLLNPPLRLLRASPRFGWESSSRWRTRHSFHSSTSSLKLHVVDCDHLAVYVILYGTTP